MRGFIKTKQLEIVNGGWSQPDEACSYYSDLIENFVKGHEWIEKEL